MSEPIIHINKITGLNGSEIQALQKKFGKNIFQIEGPGRITRILWDVIKEPMFLLLLAACSLYFILGEVNEGIMMLVAMVCVTAISVYQEVKSSKALEALKQYTEPKVTVLRDSKEIIILSEELVPGDIMLLEEGNRVPADAIIIQENDLSVNESVVTGESLPVEKHKLDGQNQLLQGTTINSW